MAEQRLTELDRLFARHQWRSGRATVPEEWSPPWQPRGRWWMRAAVPRTWQQGMAATARAWRRLVRPPRAS
jgi:hypothetical protein